MQIGIAGVKRDGEIHVSLRSTGLYIYCFFPLPLYRLIIYHPVALSHFFNITLIPGRKPSALSCGDAFTSNVFKSNCPVVLVAFQAAYVPRSFI